MDRFDRLESKLDKLDERLDKIDIHLGKVDITMSRNTDSLEEHMKRTELLEGQLESIQVHINYVQGIVKLISLISIIVGIYKAVVH